MKEISAKRVMLAAPRSGSGKTTITCALLKALKDDGLAPASYKCGPDYIDPLFHERVLGVESRNLDTYFAGAKGVQEILANCSAAYAVIEGVMGLYDGTSVAGIEGSSYEIAKITATPIILIMDASGVGRTVLSLLKGVLVDDEAHLIRGVIFNQISEHFYESIKPVFEKEMQELYPQVKLLGFFPKNAKISITSRHLGLKLPGEIADLKEKISQAAACLKQTVDIPALRAIMEEAAQDNNSQNVSVRQKPEKNALGQEPSVQSCNNPASLTLAVAYDDAFCFYYRDNLELFQKHGVKIAFFSPLSDPCIPKDANALLLGGGYPELYLEKLSANHSMLRSIKDAIDQGMPSLAECGGFMYLHKTVTAIDGIDHELVGAIDATSTYTGHLVRFGYMQIKAVQSSCDSDALYASLAGMKGHEFHYFDSSANGEACIAGKPNHKKEWNCMIMQNNGIWGFPHFYYGSDPAFIEHFIDRMRKK